MFRTSSHRPCYSRQRTSRKQSRRWSNNCWYLPSTHKSLIIAIKFKNYGLDLLEVIDDGSGISADDYDGIGSKHYTSKLTSFENLDDLETFGFRGEALSSLCALGDVQIITATREEAPQATKLEFDHHGIIVSKKVASAKVFSSHYL